MDITVNGEAHAYPTGATVAEVVTGMGAGTAPRGVAVALNGEVVPRAAWSETTLCTGDRVEVLTATQGG